MQHTLARRTIALPHPLDGAEVMAAVEVVVGSHENDDYPPTYVQESSDDGVGWQVGQTSDYPFQQLRIIGGQPNQELIDPQETYTSLVVDTYEWSRETFAIGYDFDSVIESVYRFADELLDWIKQYY